MDDKKTEIIYLRLPLPLREMVDASAEKNRRGISQEIQLRLERSFYIDAFTIDWYKKTSNDS